MTNLGEIGIVCKVMNRELQLKLAEMTLEEFRVWFQENPKNELPCFWNSRWLDAQEDPVGLSSTYEEFTL